ncbi:nicotinate-nucleotide-dimethylbenzimidazole phosphoribosyltransferase [Anaerobacterium chartisolvens]|uniref:Nicotinate-nucleotide--dimethylbenzimidazole phosphoribosyltransferase n=1 Tax=Anaerobacterium chartisolvens TaxID=1297424 RepID=A0A369AN99_9FIRM|nr:nicotinate-nucleotide--dimethylbenzimidazole phosphoribosyltransferase [Anaerobacterium chartisolvens]RCX10523.1 nicotinate-nucleotide-dimethylbenzimidazole phosphoribosyltransferase [Anaerobacterium chartisolvens]
MLLQKALDSIEGLYEDMMLKAQLRLDSLTKPLGSLGRLEDIVKQLAGITGELYPSVNSKAVVVMCADNGVVEEGVAQTSKSVTAAVTRNFTKGFTAINVLARHSNAELVIVDIGVDDDLSLDGILDRKIRRGTRNIAKGPAMTRQEAVDAIEAGIGVVGELHGKGIKLLGTGEMGIGNTTTSSAVASVLTGSSVDKMVGRGAGLSDEGLINKIRVVEQAIKLNRPDPDDPLEVLSKLGGLDIAGLVGCYIGAAAVRIPILVDGFISSAAALIAVKIKPEIRSFILPSHGSAEPGSRAVMDALGMEPLMSLGMRLGEGTGAALAFHIVDAAVAAYREMGTFDDANIHKYTPL